MMEECLECETYNKVVVVSRGRETCFISSLLPGMRRHPVKYRYIISRNRDGEKSKRITSFIYCYTGKSSGVISGVHLLLPQHSVDLSK